MDSLNQVLIFAIQIGDNTITVGQILLFCLYVMVGIIFIRWSIKYLSKKMERRKVNPDLAQVISRTYFIAVVVVLLISTLELLNVPLTAFAFISGAIAIGVGFGAQNIINNFISGWILMWERPIRIGDFLEIGDTQGTVESINTRSTRFKRVDGVHMLIPNSYLLENIVTNWTLIDRFSRTTVRVGVAYGSPVREVEKLMYQAANEHKEVLIDSAPKVLFADFGDNSLVFDLNVWVLATAESSLKSVRSDLRFRIEELFRENDLVIAFPQRDVHIDGSLMVKQH